MSGVTWSDRVAMVEAEVLGARTPWSEDAQNRALQNYRELVVDVVAQAPTPWELRNTMKELARPHEPAHHVRALHGTVIYLRVQTEALLVMLSLCAESLLKVLVHYDHDAQAAVHRTDPSSVERYRAHWDELAQILLERKQLCDSFVAAAANANVH